MGVARRRHFQTRATPPARGSTTRCSTPTPPRTPGFTAVGDGALLAALDRERTGRMRDIVATIQAEQDEAIRAAFAGILVVAGGPGTGKTAVALHRAAYLLYTLPPAARGRGRAARRAEPGLPRYIEQVLPSLGEDEAQLATVAGEAARPAARHRARDHDARRRATSAPRR